MCVCVCAPPTWRPCSDRRSVSYMQLEARVPDNKLRSFIGGIVRVLSFNTDSLCYLMFALSMTINANVLSLFYPLAAFGYGNLVYPLPKRLFWNICMVYTILMVLVKCVCNTSTFSLLDSLTIMSGVVWCLVFTCLNCRVCSLVFAVFAIRISLVVLTCTYQFFFALPIFCICANGVMNVIPNCSTPQCSSGGGGAGDLFWPQMVGIAFGNAARIMDMVVLLTLVLHRASLKRLVRV